MPRRNLCPNPSAKNNATGYAGGATFARVTDIPTPGSPRATGVRATGSGFIQCPTAACAPGDVFTVSFYQHNGTASFQFGRTVYIGYTRSAGGDTFPENYNTGSLGDVGTVARTSFTTAAAPALATGIYVLWDSLVSGIGMSAVLLEKVASLDTYADGDTSGWAWDGTDGNSTSTEATLPAEGSAAFALDLAAAATGERVSAGVAGLALNLAAAGAGQRASAGVAALGLNLAVDARGARASRGAAALGLDLAVSASSGSLSPARGPRIISRSTDTRIVTRVQVAD